MIILLIILILLFGFGGYRLGPGVGYYGGGSISLILLIVLILLLLKGNLSCTACLGGGIPALRRSASLFLRTAISLFIDGKALRLGHEACVLHLSRCRARW